MMPNVTPLELGVLGSSLVTYLIMPGVLAWADRLGQRSRARAASRAAERDPARLESPEPSLPPASATVLDDATSLGAPPVTSAETPDVGGESIAVSSRVEIGPPAVAAALPIAATGELDRDLLADPDQALLVGETFHLEDIRRAHSLESAPRTLTESQRELWDRGRELDKRFASAIEAVPVNLSAVPASAAYAGAAPKGDKLRLRYLLFSTLWPTDRAQAVATLVVEVDPGSGAATGWVLPA